MGARWRTDLAGDGVPAARIDELVDASHAKLTGAPALVLGCLTWDGLDRYPDEARRRAEWGMALLSLGAAVENLMLAAADAGLASVLGRGADLLSRRRPRRARRSPTSGSPTPACWSVTPTRRTSAASARRSPSTSSAPAADVAAGTTRAAPPVTDRHGALREERTDQCAQRVGRAA